MVKRSYGIDNEESDRRPGRPLYSQLCPAMRPWQTEETGDTAEENKRGRVGHHSSTTGISINILQWCCCEPTAVEEWRPVSHC